MKQRANKTDLFDLCKIGLFIFILLLPTVGKTISLDQLTAVSENRVLAKQPSLNLSSLTTFADNYNRYFNDNFGFRAFLVKSYSLLKANLFHTSTNPGVTLGKNGWMYHTPELTLAEIQSLSPHTESELRQIKANLESIDSHFRDRGARFYFIIAPSSQSVYPEFLPDNLQSLYRYSRLDQLESYLNHQGSPLKFINPKPDLIAAKDIGQLYYKYDLHWTPLGAFVAYQKLAQAISADFPAVQPFSVADFNLAEKPSINRDLLNLAGLTDLYQENIPVLNPKIASRFTKLSQNCPDIYNRCDEILTKINDSALPKAVIYRDSFASWLVPFLSEHFREALYIWKQNPLYTDIVLTKKPDIVILELSERSLWTLTTRIFDFQ